MRLLSAIIVSGLILIPHTAWSVPDDAVTTQSQQRNPIEWFFSDLGNLFVTAVKMLDQKTNKLNTIEQEIVKVAEPELEPTSDFARIDVDLDEDLFGEGNFDSFSSQTSSSIEAETPDQPRPSIADLFRGLFTALSQSNQSGQSERVSGLDNFAENDTFHFDDDLQPSEVSSLSEKEVEDEPTSITSGSDFWETLQSSAEAYENDDRQVTSDETLPSIGDLFASFVNAFSGQGVEESTEAFSTKVENEQGESVEVVSEESAASENQAVLGTPAGIEDVAGFNEFETAPWQVYPHVAVFTPEADIFDQSKAPVPTVKPATSMKVETAEASNPTPVIRKRYAKNPAARNHLSLGRTEVSELPEEETSFLNHLIETFTDEDTNSVDESEVLTSKIPDHLIPEEKLDLGYTAPDAARDNEPTDELTTIGEGVLKNIDLYLGANTVIGHPYQPNTHSSGACVERNLQVSIFCVTEIAWPSEIAESFAQDTAFTLPSEGVVRYENGRISRVYTPFKAQDFAEVVKFMQRRFGPPLEREIVWMHMIEAPKMPNTTFRWRAVSADRKNSVVLEVRNFDDLRRSFADLNRGMVRLYRDGSRPIFKHLSTMDLMLIQRRRISQSPVEPDAGTTAN